MWATGTSILNHIYRENGDRTAGQCRRKWPSSLSQDFLSIRWCLELCPGLKLLVAYVGCSSQGRRHLKNHGLILCKIYRSLAINSHYYMQSLDIWLSDTFQHIVEESWKFARTQYPDFWKHKQNWFPLFIYTRAFIFTE